MSPAARDDFDTDAVKVVDASTGIAEGNMVL